MLDLRNLSNKEKEVIEEFRLLVEKDLDSFLLKDEGIYYRFLKARDFDIEKAEKMLRKHIVWRKAKQLNTMQVEFVPKEIFVKFLEPSYIGRDKRGNFVTYVPAGKLDVRDVLQCIKINDYRNNFIWFSDRYHCEILKIVLEKEKDERIFPQMVNIFDMDQLTFSNATSKVTVEFLLRILQVVMDNYPELVCKIYIINAPRYYVIPFMILKNVMSSAMIQKFSVFGKDGWKEEFLRIIDADVLPAFLGGNRTDPDGDPLCKTFVTHGNVPVERYRLSDEEKYFKDKTQIQTVIIPKNERKEVEVDVAEEGSVIQWEFLVKNKDIGIGLFCKELDVVETLPIMRYYSADGTTTINYKTKNAGKYILVFDNSFSWMKSKEVEYTVNVVKPGN